MTPTYVQLQNQSTMAGLAAALPAMLNAFGKQLAEHVSPVHGLVPALGTTARSGAMPLYFRDTSDQPGALGYHDESGVYVFTAQTPSLVDGSDAVSVTASHELTELAGDPNANRWVDAPDGYDYAYELCDPVEGDAYEIDGVMVSNFVYQAYFDPSPATGAKFDYMGRLVAPFTMTPGGYLIRRVEGGAVDQIYAEHAKKFGRSSADANVHTVGASGSRVIVVEFGPKFPDARKAAKLAKAALKRAA